ncbi:MAG: amino acid ABC transporter substrate-binding protein [Candidatus Bathyarchaeia archaeon]|nr:amino acid ABC transporter substrate-binding protein [Candidatus Bathyarchaeota archaeon]
MCANALTKLQAAVIAVIIIVAAVAGVIYYYYMMAQKAPVSVKEEILFGFSVPLSGAHAYIGEMIKRGYEFAIEDINGAGGIYVRELGRRLKVRYVYYDDESDATKARTNAERLITADKVDFLLGSFSTPLVFAVATVAEEYKIVHVTTGIGSIPVEEKNYNWTFIPFHTELHNGLTIMNFLNEVLPGKGPYKIAMWMEDTTLGAFFEKGLEAAINKFADKFTVVYKEKYTPGQASYSTMIAKTKEYNPDMVFAVPSTVDAVTLIRECKELGFLPSVIYFQRAAEPPGFWSLLGEDAQGVIASFTGHPLLPIPKNKEITERYRARYGELPGVNFPSAYAAVQVLAAAIEKAGTLDQKKVRETLSTLEVDTVVGKLKFAGPGHCDPLVRPGAYLEQVVYQWQNGRQEIVWPSKYATASFIYPKPWK